MAAKGFVKYTPSWVAFLAILGSFFLFNHPVSAAIDISVSNSNAISFGEVQPSPYGVIATAQDTLTITTNCSTGANVYATSTDGGSNSLINSDAASDNIITASSNSIGSAGTLEDNTWGLNTVNNNTYYGLPEYSSAGLPAAIYTGTNTRIPIYYGAKVTNTLALGTYTGRVLYTVTINSSCLNYTVKFNKNTSGATGSMSDQTILPAGGSLKPNSFEYSGSTFLGWSTSPTGKTGTATNGFGTTADVEYADSAIFPDATISPNIEPGDSITLYAIWEKPLVAMQNFDCSTLSTNEVTTLIDNRDNHKYKVKKLPDGKCWMVNNLTLSATDLVTEGKALTSANTNIPSSDTNSYYITPKNARYTSTGSFNNSAVASASASVDFSTSYPNYIQIGYRDKNTTNNNTGNPVPEDTAYYSFYTATLGYSYRGDGKTSGSSAMDICPKGWRLPKVSDNGTSITASSSEFANLARAYNGSASWSGSGATNYNYYTSDSTIRQNMIKGGASSLDPELDTNGSTGFTYAGYYYSTTLYNVGTGGYYWSSSAYSSNSGYILYFDTSSVYPQDSSNKNSGLAVRCVAKEPTMQTFKSSMLANVGDTMELEDERDGNKYTVKKFGSGDDAEVWMTSNLTLGYDQAANAPKGLTLTSADTNIPDDTTYYLPPAGYMGSITDPATATSTTAVIFNTSNETYAKVQYAAASATGSTNPQPTGYYNFWASSLGYSGYQQGASSGNTPRDICPKGWRLPYSSSNTNGSWYKFYNTYSGASQSSMISPTEAAIPYSGYYSNTSLTGINSRGHFWSATVNSASNGYFLGVRSNGTINPQFTDNKCYGFAVRCVAK